MSAWTSSFSVFYNLLFCIELNKGEDKILCFYPSNPYHRLRVLTSATSTIQEVISKDCDSEARMRNP